ncbi:roadblock/LC7 domain-containing protein [Streptomyces sp. Ru87]|uniref:roadblock/LC7 domain-containing protein n=1 Tax=Streptomyces sp. Ru87 TaxID=2044307 RepID=UPI000BF6F2F1|nr:roadblock/LC7 domain-containing protein [Streptomyces sp. Ru87]PGH48135.1 dynein regulation protein LC7 [Streptomyces sp. Ru87]
MFHHSDPDLDWLMQGLVERVPRTRSAVLLSGDGLSTAGHGAEQDLADQLAAGASALYSLARGLGTQLGDTGEVRQVVVELGSTVLFVATAGAGARMVVVADRDVDPGVMGYEMSALAKSVRGHLATPARQPGTTTG